jgi:hypothetical protein
MITRISKAVSHLTGVMMVILGLVAAIVLVRMENPLQSSPIIAVIHRDLQKTGLVAEIIILIQKRQK